MTIDLKTISLNNRKLIYHILKRFHFTLNHFPLIDIEERCLFYIYAKPLEKTIFSAISSIIYGSVFKVYTETHERKIALSTFLITVKNISDYTKLCEKIDFSEICKIKFPSSNSIPFYVYNRLDNKFTTASTTTLNKTVFQPLYTLM